MLIAALGWLTGSALGRKVAFYGLIAVAVGFFLWRVFAAGKAAERAKQLEASLRNLRTRVKVNDEITSLSAPERRERLREWVRE